MNWKRSAVLVVAVALVMLVAIQLIPVDRTNPPVVQEPAWDSPATRALVKDACFDCHSNETTWPWYAKIAPVSWLTWRDVDEGRGTLNFSEWSGGIEASGEILEVINEGEMPPWYYTLMHPNAKLSDSEERALVAGMLLTLAQTPGGAAN